MHSVYSVPLAESNFCNPSIQSKLADFVRSSQRLSYGEITNQYENLFSQWLGVKHCIAVNSGSSANLAIVQTALELGHLVIGDYVAISSMTWSTNVMPLIQLGLIPVPIDVSCADLNITLHSLAGACESFNIKCLFITHLLGFTSNDFSSIVTLCKDKNIILLEDTCESMGTIIAGKKLGTFGLASTFSTFVGHHYSTIEGGLICSDDDEFADTLRSVISHGWRRHHQSSTDKAKDKCLGLLETFYEKYTFFTLGYNLRPTDISSFAGILSLEFLDSICIKRAENFGLMIQKQLDNKYICSSAVNVAHIDFCSNFAFPVLFDDKSFLEKFLCHADSYGVETRPLVAGNIMNHPFAKKWVDQKVQEWSDKHVINSSKLHLTSCYLPNRHNLTKTQIRTILSMLESFAP